MEDIADVLGDEAATVLFGAAFEDLVATDLPDGRNIADDYLRRRGWKESASTREYIAGLELPRFRGRAAGRDQSLSAMALASYSVGERWPRAEWRLVGL
jgi:hypothetical protein